MHFCAQEEAYRPDPLAQAIANLVKADPDAYLDKFNFRSEICISCDWRRMQLSPKVIKDRFTKFKFDK